MMKYKEFEQKFPVIHNLISTSLWTDADTYNLFELFYRFVTLAPKYRVRKFLDELSDLVKEKDFTEIEIAEIFMKDNESPFLVINEINVRDLLYSQFDHLEKIFDERDC